METQARANAGATMLAQYVYGPIAAQTITGNISGQMRVQEASAALNHFFRINVRVFDSTGTVERGTLLSPATVGTEFSDSALTNHSIPSTALTTTNTQDGDYLVIEIGRTGGLGQADMRIGDAATSDLPENETTTDDLNPWIEFDTLIVPLVGVEETTYEVQSETVNGATQFYIEDSTSVAAYGRRERVLQIKDILALGLTQSDLTAASATLYAHAVTYLLRHKDPQVAYEVDPIGLGHISGGAPTFKPGQTVRLDYEGTIETEDGREALISVNTDLYVMGYTRRFDDAGGSHWRFTVSTVARELPSDGQIFSDMMRELGVAKISPIPEIRVPSGGRIVTDDGSFWDETQLVLTSAGNQGDAFVLRVAGQDVFYLTADDTAAMLLAASYAGRKATLILTGGRASIGFETLSANTLGVTSLEVWEDGVSISSEHAIAAGDFGGGAGVLHLDEASTVPTTNPSSGGILYVESGTLKMRTTAGNVRTIASV
jgi:hypothetical protein